MPIKVAQLTNEDAKHVRTRVRKMFHHLNPKDNVLTNVRAWLKKEYPHIRFSVQGGKTPKSSVLVSWVNYGDGQTPTDTHIRASLKHFVYWNRSPIALPKYGSHLACEVENKFFTDIFGGVHIFDCVLKSPTEAQRQRRDLLIAHKEHKVLSEALNIDNDGLKHNTQKRI